MTSSSDAAPRREPTVAPPEIGAAADQMALKVYFATIGNDLTVGRVRDAAIDVLTEFAAQARAQAQKPFINALMETIGVWCSHEDGDTRCAPLHTALDEALQQSTTAAPGDQE